MENKKINSGFEANYFMIHSVCKRCPPSSDKYPQCSALVLSLSTFSRFAQCADCARFYWIISFWAVILTECKSADCAQFYSISRFSCQYWRLPIGRDGKGLEGDCLHAPWSLPWCPWIAPVETYNLLIHVGGPCTSKKMPWCPCPLKKCSITNLNYRWCTPNDLRVWPVL